ncbi:hypothetical protein AWC38_SpisGene9688 [Stylophora pistillata]|uniref:SWIM-type domain-containing protein n=1 Tax=Stylophora pistillata TaxID=50429 RepID=A0A2B4S4S0_STYPI|nr:hypothetical protein AWC38_SpisGene9688 [Stylophora pistillata]
MASLSICSLVSFFSGERKSLDRGENHFKSDHVQSFIYSRGVIKGEVQASMKNKDYKVTIYLDENLEIKNTECECPRGEFKCSHAAAIFIYGIHNLSRTDLECQWKRKRKAESVQSASQMFPAPPKKKDYSPLARDPSREDRMWLYSELKRYGKFTGTCWILSPEPQPATPLPIKTIEDIIYSEGFLMASTKEKQLEYLIENAKVEERTINVVSTLTAGQRNSPAWHQARRGRLTASNFGSVLQAKRVTPSLIKRLLGEYNLSGVKAIAWGQDNETEALKSFTNITNFTPVQTGLWLHESGVLGASPDGLVGDDSVIELWQRLYENSSLNKYLPSDDLPKTVDVCGTEVNPQTSRGDPTSSKQSLKEQVGKKKAQGTIYQKDNILTVRHNRTREISPFWLAVLPEDVQIEVNGGNLVQQRVSLKWLNQTSDSLTYTSGDVCNGNSPKCILTRVLDFSSDRSHIILTTEEDNRLCRIANGDYGHHDDNENETAPPTAEDEGEVSLPIRLPGVSLSGRRTTRFILR